MHSDGTTPNTRLSAEDLELFAYLLEEAGGIDDDQLIPPRDPDAEIPLSFAQERLWFLDQWDPGNTVYNIPFVIRLTGHLQVDAFQRSLNEIVRRHEALRTTFYAVDGQPRQIVAPSLSIALPLIDLRDLPHAEQTAEVQRLISESIHHSFDLSRGPLLRAELLRLSDHEHMLLLNIHHIVFDGWSGGLFMGELTMLYDAFAKDQPSPLPELAIQYPDFAIWQRAWLSGEVLEQQLTYWERQLGGSLPVLELPGDYARPPMLTSDGSFAYQQLPASLAQQLTALSQQEGTTLFMTLLAAFQVLLSRYTGEEDIITGSAIANRDFVDIETLLGFFLNTLPLRTDLSGNPSFRKLLQQVRETTLEAYAHQNVPFEQLVEELKPPRDTSHTPIFQVMFILQNAPVPAQGERELQIEFVRVDNGTAKFDLTFSLTEAPDGLRALAEYKTALFTASTIQRLLGHYQTLLERIVADIDQPIAQLSLLTDTEQHALLALNEPVVPPEEQLCIHQLFEAQAARTPDAPALVCAGASLSYHELNQRANQLAHYLRARGIAPEERIGLCLERSPELLVAILGVLKAGGAYVPLDPGYPAERLHFMVADAQVRTVLTRQPTDDEQGLNGSAVAAWFAGTVLDLHTDWPAIRQQPATNPAAEIGPHQLAYVIYTSGSLGTPKGVEIEHRSLVNYSQAARAAYGIEPADRVLQFASINFDASVEEISTALTSGATLVLRSDQMIETIATFLTTCDAWGISVLSLPTAFWHELVAQLDADALALPTALRLLIIGGERAIPERVAQWQQQVGTRVRLINTYGPTEATVVATLYPVPQEARESSPREVPIGRPLRNLTAYVLDRQRALVPIGVPGELCLGGAGLARGYLNRPALTAEKFVPDPFSHSPGGRLYRTGDLVRWLPDGTLEFLGRVDQQVKLRGYRIEVGEVETALRQSLLVSDAVVMAREDILGDKQLVAYIVPRDGHTPTTSELRSFLLTKIPDYMIPTSFITLERLPLTRNGKVDLRALPVPDRVRPELGSTFAPPSTPTEEQVAALWQSVLKLEQVGINDNFFALGGHSLLATQLIARLRATFQVDLPLRHLFASPTIAGVAATIDRMRWMARGATTPVAGDEPIEEGEL